MPTLSLLFSAPSTIRNLLFSGVTTFVCVALIWLAFDIPGNNLGAAANSIWQSIVLTLLISVNIWGCAATWRKLWIDLKFGRQLIKVPAASTFQSGIQAKRDVSMPVLQDRSCEEKFKYPWASLICIILGLCALLLTAQVLGGIPIYGLLVATCLLFWVNRPWSRAMKLMVDEQKYQQCVDEVEGKGRLPLDRHWISITDSNFYRYHAKRLESLNFKKRYESQFYNIFCDQDETVFVRLGRDFNSLQDYFCLTSIAEGGQIFQTHSLGDKLQGASLLEPNWILQEVNKCNFDAAIEMHKLLLQRHLSGISLSELGQQKFASLQSYIYEVTSRARVKFYNLNRRHFA